MMHYTEPNMNRGTGEVRCCLKTERTVNMLVLLELLA